MKFIASTLLSASLVAAHGYIDQGTIGGQSFTFYQPFQDPYTSPTPERVSRPVQGNGPITDVEIADIQCGGFSDGGIVGSSPAALHATAAAGSDVNLKWTLWPESHIGALVTYMAKCPDEGCQKFMPNATAVWFKVKEDGLVNKATNEWAVTPLMKEGNAGYTYTIPECLAPGFYLVRHEIISVFVANTYPGAQLYPGCHQLEVTGSGSTQPSNLVAFPGAYKPTGPGITWSSSEETYPIPGPAVFSCSGSGSSGSGSGSGSGSNANTDSKASTSAAAATSAAATAAASSSASVATTLSTRAAAVVTSSSSAAAAVPTTLATSTTQSAAAVVESSCPKKKRRSMKRRINRA